MAKMPLSILLYCVSVRRDMSVLSICSLEHRQSSKKSNVVLDLINFLLSTDTAVSTTLL
jgi:hypothetical protein